MRLTERKYGEIVSSKREKEPIQCSTFCNNCSQGTGNCNYVKEMVEKLAKYEDLEEQCIAENQCGIGELLMKWKAFFDDIAELYEYRKAEEQGLLLRLPCKVGDTLFQKRKDGMHEYKFIGVVYDIFNKEWMLEIALQINGSRWCKTVFSMRCVGETVFLTREEAEAALAEKGGV